MSLPAPSHVVRCPNCTGPADFRFATAVHVGEKNAAFFERSSDFEVVRGHDPNGSFFSAALFFHGLSRPLEQLGQLPEPFTPRDWSARKYFPRARGFENRGSIRCGRCLSQRKHTLRWPSDAFYQIEYSGKVLWAYDRGSCLALVSFIESSSRNMSIQCSVEGSHAVYSTLDPFLRHIPSHFLKAKARSEIVKRLRSVLCD